MPEPPLIVVEGPTPSALARARADVVQDGWTVVEGWSSAGRGSVCAASVHGEEDAVRAVLAAVGGAGLILEATADRALLDRLCDDLRRIGPLDHRVGGGPADAALSIEESDLLRLLMAGASLGDAARALSLSRRTADRRLASARRSLGASTTSEALVLARRKGL